MIQSGTIKLSTGKYRIPTTLRCDGNKVFVTMPFNRILINEIKMMQGARWHGFDDDNPRKVWSIANTPRNEFQLKFLSGENPYERYDRPYKEIEFKRNLYDHQKLFVQHFMTRKHAIAAGEMGTGKSLAAIEVAERVYTKCINERGVVHPSEVIWYIGPKSGVKAFKLEIDKWKSFIRPDLKTYDGLVKVMNNWQDGDPAPLMVIFDESSKVKTPTAQRSKAAMHLADAIRNEYDEEGFILEMSGSPAPKSPLDWWHQCEVACPGFLKEGDIHKFKSRLCIIEERQSITGGVYPHVVAWLDDENKCAKCGKLIDDECHHFNPDYPDRNHGFVKSKNEIQYLYERMRGLVVVVFKKDCLDLPEKQFVKVEITPSVEILRAAKLISKVSTRAVECLTLLRELSDGFQYKEIETGRNECPACHGKKEVEKFIPNDGVDPSMIIGHDDEGYPLKPHEVKPELFKKELRPCDFCGGSGDVPHLERVVESFPCPKDDQLIADLEDHEDIGRLVVWGGFTGTIDKLVELVHKQGWSTLRVDGRGYSATDPHNNTYDSDEFLIAMDRTHPRYQELLDLYPKICFIGHPKAGGMALTLHASPTAIFYSNDFSGEARFQAIDRIHRAGMDENRGCIIKDYIHLKTDQLVLNNLEKKRELQAMTMGEVLTILKETENESRRV